MGEPVKPKAVFNWSGGKDSALALYKVLRQGRYDVVALLTTASARTQRSSMHAIPVSLLEKQAAAIGLPLHVVSLTPQGDMADYSQAMERAARHFLSQGVTHFIFGDIYLHDVKSYREKQLAPLGIEVVEPLWGLNSRQVMDEFLASGLRTVVVTVTDGMLDKSFVGRTLDSSFVDDLPDSADICGENGEYHTFCYAGGMFSHPVPFALAGPEKVTYPIRLDDGTVRDYSYWLAGLRDTDG